jgi:pilus assembly protein Flp/PilA
MIAALRSFFRDERGATAIEYALIAVLMSIALIAGATALGPEIARLFETASNGFTPAAS